jgi:PadR family transcriptional regulator, regulatory protein PadR
MHYDTPMTPDVNAENSKAQMRKGLLEFCILLLISKKALYASDILQGLKEADLIVVEGTLYPLLSRLRTDELVSYEWRESKSGPPRKYYSLTKKGKDALKDLIHTWQSLSDSIRSLLSTHA